MSDQDILVFENSVSEKETPVLFSEKKYNFITDSTSNSGTFSAGQFSFDLSTFSNQQWTDLLEAVIEFPIKTTAKISTVSGGIKASDVIAGALTTVSKNGYHHWINGASLIINGQTIQSQQPHENISATYRILSTWSKDTLTKWGDCCGFALDDCSADGDSTSTLSNVVGMNNAVYATVATAAKGLDVINNQAVFFNKGITSRAHKQNCDVLPTSPNLSSTILGSTEIKNAGKTNASGRTGESDVAGYCYYSKFEMGCVRVRDLFDIEDLPMVKNLEGYLYISFNGMRVDLTPSVGATTLATVSYTPQTSGTTCPFLINTGASTVGGIVLSNYGTKSQTISITGIVDGTTADAVAGGPILSSARLLMPYYQANPKIDEALTKVNTFTTLEKIVNPFEITAGAQRNFTVTVGVPNPKRLVILPMYQNLGGTTNLANAETSAFDTCPATSSPFAKLDDIQITVANKPLYQYPIQYDYEQWVEEQSQVGLNGNYTNEMTSSLLSPAIWAQNHRFYSFDLSRCLPSDDGMSRAVQISCKNASASFGMRCIAILFYEKKWEINTATCKLQSK